MAGHNKWSKVKHKKAASDAKKSAVFGKVAKLISVESKKTGGDRNSVGLRTAIEKARAANMPSDNIERAIARGAAGESDAMESVVYEAYGPSGVALVIDVVTDNKNRSVAEVKRVLSKSGVSLAAPGSALWAFQKEADVWIPTTRTPLVKEDVETLAGLEDALRELDDVEGVYTNASYSSG